MWLRGSRARPKIDTSVPLSQRFSIAETRWANFGKDPNAEPLDQNQPAGSPAFFAGNRKFLTRKLWGFANSGAYMHHGKFMTIREAILAHAGEALSSRTEFQSLSKYDQGCVIEFLKTLQVLPAGTKPINIAAKEQSAN